MTDRELAKLFADTLRDIAARIESEAHVKLEGGRPNWAKAAKECVEEAYGSLGMIDPYNTDQDYLRHKETEG